MNVIGKYMFEANMAEQGTKCGPRFVSWNILIYCQAAHVGSQVVATWHLLSE